MTTANGSFNLLYSPRYHVDLGTHVFPTAKYGLVRDRLVAAHVVPEACFVEPPPAEWDDLALVHTRGYLERIRAGTLSLAETAVLEIPYTPEIVEGFRRMVGGTIAAARHALTDGLAANLGGGLHHAFPDHGEGFCLFNDVAVAIRRLQREGALRRAAVVDCDVHHGNGTAAIFQGDPSVFTCSLHQEHNYPTWKPAGSLDIGLSDGLEDPEYLAFLTSAIVAALASEPELIIYLAGADPYRDDELGGLALSLNGLRQRDRLVFRAARQATVPVVVLLAGGYARCLTDTVVIHAATIEEAVRVMTSQQT